MRRKNNKKPSTTTIAVDTETHQIFKKHASARNLEMKSFLRQLAELLDSMVIDVTEKQNPLEEIKKTRDQFVSFQRNFEKNKLQPLINQFAEGVEAIRQVSQRQVELNRDNLQKIASFISNTFKVNSDIILKEINKLNEALANYSKNIQEKKSSPTNFSWSCLQNNTDFYIHILTMLIITICGRYGPTAVDVIEEALRVAITDYALK